MRPSNWHGVCFETAAAEEARMSQSEHDTILGIDYLARSGGALLEACLMQERGQSHAPSSGRG